MDNFQQNSQLNEDKQMFNGQVPPVNQYQASTSIGNHPKFVSTLIFAVIELMCCNQITGIIALILAIVGNSDWNNGRVADAEGKFKGAKIALIIGLVLGMLICIGVFAIYGFAFIITLADVLSY